MMNSACRKEEGRSSPAPHHAAETIRLTAGARLVPPALLEPPFFNDRQHVMHEQAAVLLNRHLRRLARMHGPVELRITRLLGRMQHLSAYIDLGFARMTDYAVERLGLSARRTQILIQMDRRLRELPDTARAFEAGRLSQSQVRLLVRVATRHTERTWLDKTTRMNVRQLEQEVRRARAILAHDSAGAPDAAAGPLPSGNPRLAGTSPPAGPAVDSTPNDEESEALLVQVSLPAPAWLRGRWEWAVEVFRRTAGAATPVWEAAEGIAADYLAGSPADHPYETAGGPLSVPNGSAGRAPDFPDEASICAPDDDGIDLFEEVQRALEDELGASQWAPPFDNLEVALPQNLDSPDFGDDDAGGADSMDRRLHGLIELRQNLAWHQGRLLRTFANYRLHRALGFASFSRYCRENLGMSVRRARRLIALERRLLELPHLARAYRDGELSWVKASEIARVADEDTEKAWIHLARSITVRRLRDEVALAAADRDNLDASWQVRSGAPPGLTPEGQVQLCAPSAQPSPMPPSPGDEASGPGPTSAPAPDDPEVQMCARPNAITTRIRFRAPIAAAQVWRYALAACRTVEGNHLQDWECVARMVESFRRTWDLRGSPAWRRRYRIFERDGWRCRVPGCSSRRNLHAHHVVFRSRGGGGEDDNLVTVCITHHLRCLHAGTLRCHRLPDGLLAWEFGSTPGAADYSHSSNDVSIPGDTATVDNARIDDPIERYVEDVLWAAARATARSISEG